MKIGYVKEEQSSKNIINRIKIKIREIFNIIKIQNLDEKIFFILPITNKTKLNKFIIIRLEKALFKQLYDNYIEDIVLSEYLTKIDLLKNKLYSNDINILDGKYLFKALSYNILEYIYNKKNIKMEYGEISILVNDLNEQNTQNIMLISKNVKRLNIITNNIDKFKKLDEYLYNELGILITVSNNKQKSLANTEIIINYDFPNELINKYNINDNAIIINIPDKIKIKTKKFNGICISNFKLKLPKKYLLIGFNNEVIYESTIYKKSIKDIRKNIFSENIKIKELIGNNGKINIKEFITNGNNN